MQLNYDIVDALPIVLPPYRHVHFWIVGCGGTGSFLVQLIARIARTLITTGKSVKMTLVDPDHVERANTIRQCFCEAEIGYNKAQTLAARYSLAWNLDIEAVAEPFQSHWAADQYGTLTILLGCVDRASGRRSLHEALDYNRYQTTPRIWWIDAGNGDRYGQVLIGSSLSTQAKDYKFHELGCLSLPSPGIQSPELLVDKLEELEDHSLSCEQFALLNAQSLTINVYAAVAVADLALDLSVGQLRRFVVYFDQSSGTMQSNYITQEAVTRMIADAQNQVFDSERKKD
jgi:PRTRC genetic system ThiF family protein